MSSDKRTEMQRVARRIRTLEGRAKHLGELMGNKEKWDAVKPGAQNHIVAEHSALVWVCGFLDRHRGLAFTDARAIQEANDQQEASDATPL